MRWVNRRLLTLGIALAFAGLSPADESVEGAVRRLAHPKYAEREQAAKQLVEIGEPVLPPLRAALSSPDQEARQRAEQLIDRIESDSRSRKLLVAPKLRIKIDGKPLAQAVTDVAKLTGLPLTLNVADADAKRKITVDTGDLPYWEAVEAFLNAAGLGEDFSKPQPSPRQTGITEGEDEEDPPLIETIFGVRRPTPEDTSPSVFERFQLACVAKPLPNFSGNSIRVKATPVNPAVEKAGLAPGDVRLHLQVDAKPGMTVTEISGIDIRKVKAAGGRSLEVIRATQPRLDAPLRMGNRNMVGNVVGTSSAGGDWDVSANDILGRRERYAALLPVTFKSGGAAVSELEDLSGVLTARISAPRSTLFTVDRVKEVLNRQVPAGEGLRVTLKKAVTRLNRTAVVRLTMEIDNGPLPDFYLTLPSGETCPALSLESTVIETTDPATRYELAVVFEKPETWDGVGFMAKGRRVVTVDMPFTLKNVPVPAQ